MPILLQNDWIRLDIEPEQGGRINQILDLRTQKAWLWHPAGYTPGQRPLPIGANFDDHWCGGFEEMFPNDAAGKVKDRLLPDHGEVWSQPWSVSDHTSNGIVLSYTCKTVPVKIEKRILFTSNGPTFRLEYVIENLESEILPFHLKLHPALAIEENDEVLLPSCMIEPVDLSFSSLIGRKVQTPFPTAYSKNGSQISLHKITSLDSNIQEFYYATQLSENWCGILNNRTGSRLPTTLIQLAHSIQMKSRP
jgi:hypothetical protein